MKKLLLQIAFLLIMVPAFSSGTLYVYGTVTDSATGYPVSNYPVTLMGDSVSGFNYYHTVYTNASGFYGDTVNVTTGSTGTMYIRTHDCNNILHQDIWSFAIGQSHTANFSICTSPAGLPAVTTGNALPVTQAGATLHGTVNPGGPATTVTFEYGMTTAYGGVLSTGIYSGNTAQNVAQPITGLSAGTLYHYRINGVNLHGTSYGADSVFTTLTTQPPMAITESATGITDHGATIHGLYNANGNSAAAVLEWGLSPYYGSWGSGPISGNSNYPMQIGILNLPPNTTYHYRAYATYPGGNVYGYDSTFTTLGSSSCQSSFSHYSDSLNPLTVHFTDQSTTGAGYITTWLWAFGDGTYQTINYPSSPNVTHTYAPSNTPYVASLTIHGSDTTCYSVSWDTISTGATGCQAAFTHYLDSLNAFTVHFNDLSTTNTGYITKWNWDFGDGTYLTVVFPMNPNVTHTYAGAALTHTVCLTIQGSDSTCYSTVCEPVVVGNGGCQAAFNHTPDSVNTYMVHFTDLSSTGSGVITTWTWDFGDGNVQTITYPGNPDVTHTYLAAGTYNACLAIHGSDSSCYDVVCHSVSTGINTGCIANFAWSTPPSVSTPTQFTDLSQAAGAGPITSWLWNFGDPAAGTCNTSNSQNPVHQYIFPGNYTVCLTIHGTDSTCYDMLCETITVIDSVACQANFTVTDTIPAGYYLHFLDLSTGSPTAWLWNFGDGTTSTVQNPYHLYPAPGTYTVCLTIAGNNCTSTHCEVIVVPGGNYHQIYGQVFEGSFPLQQGMVMIFSLDTTNTYQPYVDVYTIDSNGVYYFTQVPDGNYYILAVPFDSNGYLPTYYGNTITWGQATLIALGTPNNPYNINLVAGNYLAPGPGSASGQINTGDVISTLTDKINMILKNEQGQAIGFTQVSVSGTFEFPSLAYGTYYLYAEMPGVTSDNIMIVLSAENPHADVTLTFTGKKILGIHEANKIAGRWSVYPNPAGEKFTLSIDMKQAVKGTLRLFSPAGLTVYSSPVTLNAGANATEISTVSLPVGIYTLRLSSPEGLNIITKLVKIR